MDEERERERERERLKDRWTEKCKDVRYKEINWQIDSQTVTHTSSYTK
jgi:hypothetical protein